MKYIMAFAGIVCFGAAMWEGWEIYSFTIEFATYLLLAAVCSYTSIILIKIEERQ